MVGLAKHPILLHRIGTLLAPLKQIFRHVAVEWNRLGGGFCFAIPDLLMPDGSGHTQLKVLEIHIRPPNILTARSHEVPWQRPAEPVCVRVYRAW